MSRLCPIVLNIAGEIPEPARSRMTYAFRIFAAIYGYQVAEDGPPLGITSCHYGTSSLPESSSNRTLAIPARYRPRKPGEPTPQAVKHRYGGEDVYLFHGKDDKTGNPDWLAEIFEWLSLSHEREATTRDTVGRIPYAESIFARQNISPRKPQANFLMAWMQNSLCNENSAEALPKAPSPITDAEHLVVSSHDIDFYHVSRVSTFVRLIKNLGISYRLYRSWSYFSSSTSMMLELFAGRRVGDYLPALLDAGEKYNFGSTLFVVARHGHRRDPNYELEEILARLQDASIRGFAVGLHGSYSSVLEDVSLNAEALTLEQATGSKVRGSRQHWLRFNDHQKLFEAIEGAGLVFDSTLGFSDEPGFRNGAAFAFPPYDFKKEKPFNFLEIPLVLMDGNIEAATRKSGESAAEIAGEILGQSRKFGWGGVATLWHNPVEPLSAPVEINEVFWGCVKAQQRFRERWVNTNQFMSHCLSRYQSAGLMKGVCLDA